LFVFHFADYANVHENGTNDNDVNKMKMIMI